RVCARRVRDLSAREQESIGLHGEGMNAEPRYQVVRLRRRNQLLPKAKAEAPTVSADAAILQRLDDLHAMALRLRPPTSHSPARFHEDKSDLVRAIGSLAADLRKAGKVR